MKTCISLLLCFFTLNAVASTTAMTENGDVVILNKDGTWQYQDENAAMEVEIPTNPNKFTQPDSSNFTLKSSKTNSSFAINSKKWKFKKNKNGHESAEYTFEFNDGDIYGMAISEQVQVDVEELVKIAFNNALAAAPDTQIIKKEYRMVNGHKVIYMEMIGTIQSIKFQYLGYYYSNESGSTQFLAYTGANLVKKFQDDIDNFLNGFSVSP
ncbi:hypothetical protein QX776_13545 [Alteromonadaceae bacterium BrNp21-10]|nr:hypothetical protein [Alteromonadaceae bacterium BrNp21-10]